jgi:hypothetical protein
MAFIRTRTAPSPYPRLIFHGLRIGQALASLVVGGIMFYFIHNLRHESYDPPKTFWVVSDCIAKEPHIALMTTANYFAPNTVTRIFSSLPYTSRRHARRLRMLRAVTAYQPDW